MQSALRGMIMIRISNLVKDYEVRSEKIRVLDHIDLTVEDGEILELQVEAEVENLLCSDYPWSRAL